VRLRGSTCARPRRSDVSIPFNVAQMVRIYSKLLGAGHMVMPDVPKAMLHFSRLVAQREQFLRTLHEVLSVANDRLMGGTNRPSSEGRAGSYRPLSFTDE